MYTVFTMRISVFVASVVRAAAMSVALASTQFAPSVDTASLQHLRWRMIGPHRGGRTVGAVGVPQRPGWFYIGVNNGGVWRTTDYVAGGRHCSTISQPVPSVTSPSHHPIPMCYGLEAVKDCSARIFRRAMASTDPLTAAAHSPHA